MAQEHKQKQTSKRETEEIEELPERQDNDLDIEGILDEIDEVLEENAEEFVRGYVQKGGE